MECRFYFEDDWSLVIFLRTHMVAHVCNNACGSRGSRGARTCGVRRACGLFDRHTHVNLVECIACKESVLESQGLLVFHGHHEWQRWHATPAAPATPATPVGSKQQQLAKRKVEQASDSWGEAPRPPART